MKSIMIVEDDMALQDALAVALNPAKYRIVAYNSGNEILHMDTDAPDLFLLDKNLSGISGLDICRFIKKNPYYSHAPVVMISAVPGIVAMAMAAGADFALPKPFSVKTLRDTVARYTS